MKKSVFICCIFLISVYSIFAQVPSFTIQNISSSSSITCATPSVNLIAFSNYSSGILSYSWVSPNTSLTGSNVITGTPGIYTVSATSGTATSSQTVSIGVNTIQPTGIVSPSSQTITCGNAAVNVTATASTSNVLHTFKSPFGGIYSVNTATAYYLPGGPGTYTHIVTNAANGCSFIQTFSASALPGFPTGSLVSSHNFSIGCSVASVVVISVTNAATSPTTGGTISYSIQGFPSVPGLGSYTINTPGTWTVTIKDNVSLCETKIPFTITQNTATPYLFAVVPKQVLDCSTPKTALEGFSSDVSNAITWLFAGTPGGPVNPINVVTNSFTPTSTLINTYTLLITDNSNLCITSSVVPMYQNIFAPLASIGIAPTKLTCLTPTVLLTNTSTTGIPANSVFPNNQPVIAYQWLDYAPQPPFPLTNAYVAGVSGTYTLVVKDLNNGCISSATIHVGDDRIFPTLETPPPFLVPCPNGTVTISPIVIGNTSAFSFSWQIIPNATVSGTNTAFLTTNAPGPYTVTATNTLNGCSTSTLIYAYACVAIPEQENFLSEIYIFPNPVKTKLSLQVKANDKKHFAVTIKDISGKTMYVLENYDYDLDLSSLVPGLYFMELRTQQNIRTIKLIKE